MSGKLSTHVLDTALGRPAAGVAITLWYLGDAPPRDRPETTRPEAGLPYTSLPDASLPEAGLPDTSLPDAILPEAVARAVTNDDGRTDAPLLSGETMRTGRYRLTFAVGAYYRSQGHPDAGRFLEEVPVEFVIADASAGYHVPLLVTPWSYSTYRGS